MVRENQEMVMEKSRKDHGQIFCCGNPEKDMLFLTSRLSHAQMHGNWIVCDQHT